MKGENYTSDFKRKPGLQSQIGTKTISIKPNKNWKITYGFVTMENKKNKLTETVKFTYFSVDE